MWFRLQALLWIGEETSECTMCNRNDREDLVHVLCRCLMYVEVRHDSVFVENMLLI